MSSSHDTVRRVFAAVKPGAFEECFHARMNACSDAAGLQRIHIDGKTLRGSGRKGKGGEGSFAPLPRGDPDVPRDPQPAGPEHHTDFLEQIVEPPFAVALPIVGEPEPVGATTG